MQQCIPFILQQTGAKQAEVIANVQTLWSGYGQILRYQLYGCERHTVIVKHIQPPQAMDHPRGWNTDFSHQRKLQSYQVELAWYRDWATRCDDRCPVPSCLGVQLHDDNIILILEDLDNSGYPLRHQHLSFQQMQPCLRWLANFHARFLGEEPRGLWPIGTYWHLDTRPDELSVMMEGPLKQAAQQLDSKLNGARFKTLVHGDAKVANFCFSASGQNVAAVDFQYVGGGCGSKDLAYFISSCLSERECERLEEQCLDFYFQELRDALLRYQQPVDWNALEREWRELYVVAWADFYRFLQGWMPTHKKVNRYSSAMTERALSILQEKS